MRIKDLHYTKNPSGIIELGGELEIDINQMFLLSLGRLNKQTLRLNLKADHKEVTAYVRLMKRKERQEKEEFEKMKIKIFSENASKINKTLADETED